jgi:hypothetical protein
MRGAFLPQGPTELVVQRSPTSNGHVIGIPSAVVRAYIAQVRLSGLTPTGDARRLSGESRRPSGEYESPVVTRDDQVLPFSRTPLRRPHRTDSPNAGKETRTA